MGAIEIKTASFLVCTKFPVRIQETLFVPSALRTWRFDAQVCVLWKQIRMED